MAAKPEAKRFAVWHLREETGKGREQRTGRIAITTACFEIPRPPAFPGEPDGIAGLFEKIGIDGEPLRQKAMETAPFFEAMGILTGEHRSPGGSAGRRCAKTKIEENSLARHAIKRGSMDNLVSVNTRVRTGQIG